jgi:transcriptional regulator with XRE-family HTH domain
MEKATFAARLKVARRTAAISQEKLAEQIGVSASTIYLWEKGATEPHLSRLSAVATALSCDPSWLACFDTCQQSANDTPNRLTAEVLRKFMVLRQFMMGPLMMDCKVDSEGAANITIRQQTIKSH